MTRADRDPGGAGGLAEPAPRIRSTPWLLAIRPRTLVAGAVPVAVGTALAAARGPIQWAPALAALGGALLIQIGTNLANDYYDWKRGADTVDRLGPPRATQQGLLPPRRVLGAAFLSFALAMVVGLYLVWVGGWPIVAIGLASLAAGYAYTGGPYPLAYHGLGDLFVWVFFGFVAVGGSFWLQARTLDPSVLLAAVPVGALGNALLVVNNLRDVHTDEKAGKRTLVVRWGVTAARAQYVLLLAVAFCTPLVMWWRGDAGAAALIALLAVPAAAAPLRLVLTADGRALNGALAATARLQMLFGVGFALGIGWGA